MHQLTDIGVNLTDKRFNKDLDDVIARSFEHGIQRLIITGTSLDRSERALELCQQFPQQLYCTVGVHPHDAKSYTAAHFAELKQMSEQSCVVAIGETGLDFNRNFSEPEQQKHAFEQQLELAAETKLPLFLHERDAHQTQTEMLHSTRDHIRGGVAHCFTGTKQELYNYLDLDLYIGITGWICDERRGQDLLALTKDIPADRLLIETDAPYLTPRDLRPKPKGGRNEPCFLPHILNTIAEQRQVDPAELASITEANVDRLFFNA